MFQLKAVVTLLVAVTIVNAVPMPTDDKTVEKRNDYYPYIDYSDDDDKPEKKRKHHHSRQEN